VSALAAALAVLVVVGSLALAGCGGGRSGPPAGSASEIKAYDINPVAREKVRDGGVLRWGLNEYPANWNLNHVDGNLATVKRVMDGLMPSPFRSNESQVVRRQADHLGGLQSPVAGAER
jgi:peptide/nickel transport system substrate-binding protein